MEIKRFFSRSAGMLVLSALFTSAGLAGTTWDGGGGDNNFGTGTNWSPDGAPSPGTSVDLTFAGSTRLTPYNNYTAWDDFRAIYFAAGASSFTITGNAMDLYDTSNGGKIENNSSVLQQFNINDFSINSGTYEFNPVSGDLTLGGGGNIYNNGNSIEVWGDNGHTLTIAKNLQHSGGLTVQQNSIVEFKAASTYTGDTIINEGSVRIGEGGSLGGTIVRVGATSGSNAAGYFISDANGGTTEDTSIVIRNGSSGTKTLGGLNTSGMNTFSGGVSLDDNVTLSASAGGTMEFSGAITDGLGPGTYGVAINAAGTVRLSGSSANSGQSSWTLQAGTLELSKNSGVDAINSAGITIQSGGTMRNLVTHQISDSGNVTIQSGGAWDLNGFNETINSLSLASGSTLSLGAAQLIVNNQAAGTWAGTISGSSSGSIVKKGANTISVTGNNSGMAGSWYVVGGTVGFNHNNAAGSGTIYLGETSGSDAATIDISVNGVNVGNDIVVRSGSSGTKTIDQAVGGSGTVTFSGDITLNDNVNVTAGGGETLVLSGDISGSGKIIKQSDGTVTLSGNNTYTGNTEIDAGTLNIGGDLSGTYIYLGNGGNSSSATLELSGSGSTLGGLQVNVSAGSGDRTINVTAGSHTMSGSSMEVNRVATINASGGSLNIAHTVNLNMTDTGSDEMTINSTGGSVTLSGSTAINLGADKDLGVTGSGSTTISGAISASTGAAQINKSGSGTLTISGNNSGSLYMLNIAGGTVALSHANSLGTAYSDKINVTGSGTVQVNANVGPSSLGVRVGSGQTATLAVGAGNTFTVETLSNISGSGTFTKTGSGTLTLTGNSGSLSGTLNVSAGTVNINSGATVTPSSGINLSSGTLNVNGTAGSVSQTGGTLMGNGTVNGLVQNGGTLSPGSSPGTLTISGNATWNSGTYLWEINDLSGTVGNNPGWDYVDISGTLTISAGYTVTIDDLNALSGWNTLNNYSWLIATADGGISGFSNLGLNTGSWNQNSYGGTFSLRQDGNDIYLDYTGAPLSGGGAVPEPNTLIYFGLATAGLIALRRKGPLMARLFDS